MLENAEQKNVVGFGAEQTFQWMSKRHLVRWRRYTARAMIIYMLYILYALFYSNQSLHQPTGAWNIISPFLTTDVESRFRLRVALEKRVLDFPDLKRESVMDVV
jgi:hypothetical protein